MRRTGHVSERRMWRYTHRKWRSTRLRQKGCLMPPSSFLSKRCQGSRNSLIRLRELNLVINYGVPFGFESTLAV